MAAEALLLVDEGRMPASFSSVPARVLRSEDDISDAALSGRRKVLWVAFSSERLSALARSRARWGGDRRLLLLDKAGKDRLPFLRAFFRVILSADQDVRLLPLDELADVLADPRRADFLIGGVVDEAAGALVLYRGDLEPLAVPMDWFRPTGTGTRPDFGALEFRDYGLTVGLGPYEASSDAILYEFNERYRRRARARSLDEDESFGGSLRRLRVLKGLGRDDFPGLSARTVARLERGETEKPQGRTLEVLCRTLGVTVEEITTY